jgi:L-asparaginase
MERLLVITTGGTIFQRANHNGVMHLGLQPSALLESLKGDLNGVCDFDIEDLNVRSGAELTWPTIFRARDAVQEGLQAYAGFLLITGTDTMEEFAYSLSLLLDGQLQRQGKTLAITGAMLPGDQLGCDGPTNVRDAAKVGVTGVVPN